MSKVSVDLKQPQGLEREADPAELHEVASSTTTTTMTYDELQSKLRREEQAQTHKEFVEKTTLSHREQRTTILLRAGLVILAVILGVSGYALVAHPTESKEWAVPLFTLIAGGAFGFAGGKSVKSEDKEK